MSVPAQPLRRLPGVCASSVMTVKSGALRVSGLAARSVMTIVVPGCSVRATRLTPGPSRIFDLPEHGAGPQVDRDAVLRLSAEPECRPLQEETVR